MVSEVEMVHETFESRCTKKLGSSGISRIFTEKRRDKTSKKYKMAKFHPPEQFHFNKPGEWPMWKT